MSAERVWADVTGVLIDVIADQWPGPVAPAVPKPRPAELVVVRRLGGGDDGVLDRARMGVDVWSGEPGGSQAPAHALAARIREILRQAPFTHPGCGLARVTIDSLGFLPDEVTATPRVIITATVTAKPSTGS